MQIPVMPSLPCTKERRTHTLPDPYRLSVQGSSRTSSLPAVTGNGKDGGATESGGDSRAPLRQAENSKL
eukprot:scaffold28117_cov56-Attheya_sp.AAC.4